LQAIYYTGVLEYCAPIWSPYHQSDINKIEIIQHRAVHFVLKKSSRRNYQDSVSSMLADLQRPLLSQRRKYARLTILYKSLNNFIVTNSLFFLEQYQSGMISLQELCNVNHLIFLISICMNILLYNCMLHISPYAPGGLW